LSRQLVQIIGRNKFSIRFESLCCILRVSPQTRMSQNQAKSNYKDCSFRNRDSFVKGTRLSVFILAKSQASWKFFSKQFYLTFIHSKSRHYRIHKILCTQLKRPLIYSQHRSATQTVQRMVSLC